jgi:hypothetical protein
MKVKSILGAGLLTLLVAMPAARAANYNFNFPLDGLQEVPPVATPSTGTGVVLYDDVTNTLQWNISYTPMIGTVTNAHFHGPAPVGVNAGVRIGLDFSTNPIVGSTVISEAFETELLAGLWYVNIHSTFRPGGEIRGQVVPEPASIALLGLLGAAVLRRRRAQVR